MIEKEKIEAKIKKHNENFKLIEHFEKEKDDVESSQNILRDELKEKIEYYCSEELSKIAEIEDVIIAENRTKGLDNKDIQAFIMYMCDLVEAKSQEIPFEFVESKFKISKKGLYYHRRYNTNFTKLSGSCEFESEVGEDKKEFIESFSKLIVNKDKIPEFVKMLNVILSKGKAESRNEENEFNEDEESLKMPKGFNIKLPVKSILRFIDDDNTEEIEKSKVENACINFIKSGYYWENSDKPNDLCVRIFFSNSTNPINRRNLKETGNTLINGLISLYQLKQDCDLMPLLETAKERKVKSLETAKERFKEYEEIISPYLTLLNLGTA